MFCWQQTLFQIKSHLLHHIIVTGFHRFCYPFRAQSIRLLFAVISSFETTENVIAEWQILFERPQIEKRRRYF